MQKSVVGKSVQVGRKSQLDAFQKGYLVGKAEVYCEQVRAGAKLVGAFGFDRGYIGLVKRTVRTEGCKLVIDQSYSPERATAYVYRYAFVRAIIYYANQVSIEYILAFRIIALVLYARSLRSYHCYRSLQQLRSAKKNTGQLNGL